MAPSVLPHTLLSTQKSSEFTSNFMALLQAAGSLGCSEEPKEAESADIVARLSRWPVSELRAGCLPSENPSTICHSPKGTLSPPEDRSDAHVWTGHELGSINQVT